METIHPQILWVVGQRVSVVSVTKSYSLAETLAPPAAPRSRKLFRTVLRARRGAGNHHGDGPPTARRRRKPDRAAQQAAHLRERDGGGRTGDLGLQPARLRAVLSGHGRAGRCPERPRGQKDPQIIERIKSEAARYGMHILPPPDQTTKQRGLKSPTPDGRQQEGS
jgi:hypothetical protein